MRLLAVLAVVSLVSLSPARGRAQQAAPADSARTGALDGVVRDSTGAPLGGAVVAVEALGRSVFSDAAGRFRLGGLPTDTVDVSVRRVGFSPAYFSVAIAPRVTVSIAVRMLPSTATLGTVRVEGERDARDLTLNRSGFYDRKRSGSGVFLGPEFMDTRRGIAATTLLREVPRVRVRCPSRANMGCVPLLSTGAGSCVPDLVIDGVAVATVGGDFDAIVDTRYVRGIEVYRTYLETPPRFVRPQNGCGSIVVWTEMAPPARRKRTPAAAADTSAAGE